MRGARALAAAALLVHGALAPARAGDFATRVVLGFSPDGKVFAFEEHGVQDGSGFPYANVYFIDTARDEWLPGTPIRVRIDDEDATGEQARARAREQAAPLLQRHDIAERGGVVASSPVTELSADPHEVVFNPRIVVPPIDDPHTLSLKEIPLPGESICKDFGQTHGFSLEIRGPGFRRVLHTDTRIPTSRPCPLKYGIADVITYYPDGAAPVLAVLILMQSVGFEGPDGRYLAVTARLN